MEYITKKLPKGAAPVITELQAEYTLAEGRRVTEGEAIMRALRQAIQKKVVKKKYTLRDLSGSIKGGPRTREEEIDDVVYGDVDKT